MKYYFQIKEDQYKDWEDIKARPYDFEYRSDMVDQAYFLANLFQCEVRVAEGYVENSGAYFNPERS